jgi:hypothetical protein
VITASKLREDVYRILDEVLESGVPVEIHRKGKKLKIIRAEESESSWLDNLPERPWVVEGDPEDLVHIDWSKEWRPGPI